MKASKAYKKGMFNVANIVYDASTKVTTVRIYRHGWSKAAVFKVKDLYGSQEEIIEDEETDEQEVGE
jgi:hypothetical protein